MGTAQVQGDLWGARAEDWANLQEPQWRPVFEQGLSLAGMCPGTMLLDVGCGAGGALAIAAAAGAQVSGLDGSANLVAIARRRLAQARIEVGEMEDLPFGDESFDVVTGFNSFQFAGDLVQALGEARRVCRRGGTVFMLAWGARDDCELMTITIPAVFGLLPPPPPEAKPSGPLLAAGVAEDAMRQARLEIVDSGDFSADLAFPDADTAVRATMSAGVTVRAIRLAGEVRVGEAIRSTLPRVMRPDGSIVWSNRFHWVKATRPD